MYTVIISLRLFIDYLIIKLQLIIIYVLSFPTTFNLNLIVENKQKYEEHSGRHLAWTLYNLVSWKKMKMAWYSSQLKETKQTNVDQNIHLSVLLQYIRYQWNTLSLWFVVLWIKKLILEKNTHINGKKEYGIQACPALQRLDLCHFTFVKDLYWYLFSLM